MPRNPVLHHLAVLKAARDFGVPDAAIAAVAGRFDPQRLRTAQVAEALADLVLAQPAEGRMFGLSRNTFSGS